MHFANPSTPFTAYIIHIGRAHTLPYRVVFAVNLKYLAARWLFPKIDKYLAISSSLDGPNGIRHQCYSMNIVHCVFVYRLNWNCCIAFRQRMHNYLACTLCATRVRHFRVIETEITKALTKSSTKCAANAKINVSLSPSLSLSPLPLDLLFLLIIVNCNCTNSYRRLRNQLRLPLLHGLIWSLAVSVW